MSTSSTATKLNASTTLSPVKSATPNGVAVFRNNHEDIAKDVKAFYAEGKVDGTRTIKLSLKLYDLVRNGSVIGNGTKEKMATIVEAFAPVRPPKTDIAGRSEFGTRDAIFKSAVIVAVMLAGTNSDGDLYDLKLREVALPMSISGKKLAQAFSITAAAKLCKAKLAADNGVAPESKGDAISKKLKAVNAMFDTVEGDEDKGEAREFSDIQISAMQTLIATLQVHVDRHHANVSALAEEARRTSARLIFEAKTNKNTSTTAPKVA